MSNLTQKTDLSRYNNDWYQPGNVFKRVLWYTVNVLFFKNPLFVFGSIKVSLLRLFGAQVGKGVVIKPNVNIKYPWKLTIGNNVWIGEEVWIDNLGDVTLGDHSCLSQGSMLLCGNHNYKKVEFDLIVGNIVIEEGAWIGAHAVVCPGIKCKSHSVLSVNSVATSNLEPYSIYMGNPAVKIKDRIFKT
ncbi:MAG: WcaF family extracellular polysaccharide biosynthesis acetyltransferase [Flavobacteriales bacterium]|nr:WcaF family extracellular polysaccharide biosynthesis acetyltransferase [Flavobacteriales bacterium]